MAQDDAVKNFNDSLKEASDDTNHSNKTQMDGIIYGSLTSSAYPNF